MPRAPAVRPRLENPMAENRNALRTSILPGLLEALALNSRQDQPGGAPLRAWGPSSGPRAGRWRSRVASASPLHVPGGAEATLMALREVQQTLLLVRYRLAFSGADFEPARAPGFHPGRSAAVLAGGAACGIVGEVHPTVLSELGLAGRAVAAEVLFDPF